MTITTDIASMPMVWVIPLALYLLTFVLAFRDRAPLSVRNAFFCGLSASIIYAVISVHLQLAHTFIGMALALLSFFLLAYGCHRLVFEKRPEASKLTSYYIYLSVGGALGGVFNSLAAPVIFNGAYEFTISIIAALITLCAVAYGDSVKSMLNPKNLIGKQIEAIAIALALIAGMLVYYTTGNMYAWIIGVMLTLIGFIYIKEQGRLLTLTTIILMLIPVFLVFRGSDILLQERNYFGVKRVSEKFGVRDFVHGTTNHGSQILEEKYRLTPITYYNPTGPAADIFRVAQMENPQANSLILGLGIGGLSCLADKNSSLTYIEIDPDVIRLAEDRNFFTFVSDCGPKETMIAGDGRLELAKLADQSYDLLFMDAFSSDSIPFHLITVEAVKLYLQKLKEDGFIAFHISNRYFTLSPELAAIARDLDLKIIGRSQADGVVAGTNYGYSGTTYYIMTKNQKVIDRFKQQETGWAEFTREIPTKAWHDDHINVIRSFKFVRGWDHD